jgi:hypothetical protein
MAMEKERSGRNKQDIAVGRLSAPVEEAFSSQEKTFCITGIGASASEYQDGAPARALIERLVK